MNQLRTEMAQQPPLLHMLFQTFTVSLNKCTRTFSLLFIYFFKEALKKKILLYIDNCWDYSPEVSFSFARTLLQLKWSLAHTSCQRGHPLQWQSHLPHPNLFCISENKEFCYNDLSQTSPTASNVRLRRTINTYCFSHYVYRNRGSKKFIISSYE